MSTRTSGTLEGKPYEIENFHVFDDLSWKFVRLPDDEYTLSTLAKLAEKEFPGVSPDGLLVSIDQHGKVSMYLSSDDR